MIEIVGSTVVNSGTISNPASIDVPAGVADGDLLIYFGGSTGYLQSGFTAFSGVRYRVASSEPASYVGAVIFGGILAAFRGVATDPDQWLSANAEGTWTAPSLDGGGGLLYCALTAGSTVAAPAGMAALGTTTGSARYTAAALVGPPTPTGPRTFTGTGTPGNAWSLLLPAPATPGFAPFF